MHYCIYIFRIVLLKITEVTTPKIDVIQILKLLVVCIVSYCFLPPALVCDTNVMKMMLVLIVPDFGGNN